jgi:carbohydrate diacid regulator
LAIMTTQFERVAEAVTDRVSELLHAPITVVDGHGLIVSSSDPSMIGLSFARDLQTFQSQNLRVPFRLDGRTAEVIVGEAHNDEQISPRLAQVLVELVINQTAVVDRLPNQHETKNNFIYHLLQGQFDDDESVQREARLLGMDFTPPRAVILIDAADYILSDIDSKRIETDAQIRRRVQFVIGTVVSFFHLPNDTICAYIGDGEVAVLKASNTRNLATWADGEVEDSSSWANLVALRRAGTELLKRLQSDTDAAISIGIGRYHPGIRGLARSYQDARAALSLGQRFHGRNGVHGLDALGIAAFVGVSDEATKIDLAMHLLSPLDHEPELLETLSIFFAHDCCPSSTAKELSIHRNTLSYRLDKIASLTGLDPRCFDHAVQIRLALLLRSFSHAL